MKHDEKKKVLVSDDDPEIVTMVSRALRPLDVELSTASNGAEALERVREQRPDLVVLDVMMPEMTGWEVCRALREDEALCETPILMLTGIGHRLNEMTSPLYGANAYLDKPFALEVLRRRAQTLLDGGRVDEDAPDQETRGRESCGEVRG